jgi:phosphomannomutase
MVFSTDGDGDRPLVSDEHGNWLRGDILGLLTSIALNIKAVVVPVSNNTAIELCERFAHVERTKIGSPYVIAEFEKLAGLFETVAGFEANGGYLLGTNLQVNGQLLKALPTRDAVLPAIMLLAAADESSISSLVSSLPRRFTDSNRLQNFATEKSQQIIAEGKKEPERLLAKLGFNNAVITSVDETDGLRITLTDKRIVHLRPSGNAPEFRCYVEAESFSDASDCVKQTLKHLNDL